MANLALYDPDLAARLVPDQVVQAAVIGAILVTSENPQTQLRREALREAPIGPWPTSAALIQSIQTINPEAFGGLYRALGPRFAIHCGVAQPPISDCDGLFRKTVTRLASPAVSARVAGNIAIPVTPTQRELARLGPDVVAAGNAKLEALERVVWGDLPRPKAN